MQQVAQFIQGSPDVAILHGVEFGLGLFRPLLGGAELAVGFVDGVAEFVAFAELEAVEVARGGCRRRV